MGTSNYTLRDSNKSSGGTYLSIRVSLIVANEKERLDIFTRLKDSPAVKMVL
ncbi:MAG: HP0495 family protein [Fibrobacterota bacterium]